MNIGLSIPVAAIVAAVLGGCATQPLPSELLGTRYFRTPIDTYPVSIVSVDGRSSTLVPIRVDPGRHRIALRSTPGGAGFSDRMVFELDVKPCTRYYIVAQHANPLSADFTPKIDFQEPLAGCRAPPGWVRSRTERKLGCATNCFVPRP